MTAVYYNSNLNIFVICPHLTSTSEYMTVTLEHMHLSLEDNKMILPVDDIILSDFRKFIKKLLSHSNSVTVINNNERFTAIYLFFPLIILQIDIICVKLKIYCSQKY